MSRRRDLEDEDRYQPDPRWFGPEEYIGPADGPSDPDRLYDPEIYHEPRYR